MRVLLTGGGTAGHINPAIAIARTIKARRPGAEILFVGAEGGMEEKLVTEAGFALRTYRVSGITRSLSPRALAQNLRAAARLSGAMRAARKLIDEFLPDAVIGTGGFASYPAVRAAQKKGVPTLIHESNVMPGKTNKQLAARCTRVLVGSEDAVRHFRDPSRCVVTGNPLREGMVFSGKDEAKRALGIEGKLVLSMWGSLGAREMNRMTAGLFALEQKNGSTFRHIHSTGSYGWAWMPQYVAELGVDLSRCPNIDMREYVFDAPRVLAAADLILCRAGAMTMSEVCATGTPAVIVPSPNVADDHQRYNARSLSDRGAAVYLEEADADPETVFSLINELLNDEDRLKRMSDSGLAMAVFDASDRIWRILCQVVESRG